MIVIDIRLQSAISHTRDRNLGTLIIDNIGGTDARGDYRVRMFKSTGVVRKQAGELLATKPTRVGYVRGHRRKAEPVQNLVAKALKELGYA